MNLRIVLSAILLLLLQPTANAVDPARSISQYGHTAWRVQDGAFSGPATMIQQSGDGYLWVGTRSGLYKFDGVRFQEFVAPHGEPLRSPRVVSILTDADGSLWIGTGSDLEHLKGNELVHYPAEVGRSIGTVIDIRQGRDGKIWAARIRVTDDKGPLCEVSSSGLECHGSSDGVNVTNLAGTVEKADGDFLLADGGDLYTWNPRSHEPSRRLLSMSDTVDGFQSMVWSPNGKLMLSSGRPEYGLSTLEGDRLVPLVVPGFDGGNTPVSAVMYDSHGALWIGTQNAGIYRIAGTHVEHYRASDGLSGDTIYPIFEDREGDIWVGTSQGLDRFRDVKVATYSSHQGLTEDLINAVTTAPDGSVWASNWHSLVILKDGAITSMQTGKEIHGGQVTSVYAGHSGRVWVGVDEGLFSYVDGKLVPQLDAAGKPLGAVPTMVEDRLGNLWARARYGVKGALLRISDGKVREEVGFDQLPFGNSGALTADPDGGVWLPLKNGNLAHWHDGKADIVEMHREPGAPLVGAITFDTKGTLYASTPQGLYAWRDGKLQLMDASNGLPCTNIYTMLADGDSLWLYAQCGLLSVDGKELARWWSNPRASITTSRIGALDGAQPASAGWAPRASRGPDGRLWFANASVLQMYDPHQISRNTLPPPVHVQAVIADQKAYLPDAPIELPALTRNLEIDYTALSFAIPEKVAFRYKLEGHDDQWTDAGTRRQAFYTDLKPGAYSFRVIATNNDGVWNTQGAVSTLRVLPAFYQTVWFRILCVIVGIGLLWVLYLWRVRQVAQRLRLKIETRLRERERIARELHDTLLQGMQGLVYAFHAGTRRLPDTEPVRPLLEAALQQADQVLGQGRDQVQGLRRAGADSVRPLDVMVSQAAARVVNERGCHVHVTCSGEPRALNAVVAEEMLALSIEALNNALRHATASNVYIEVAYQESQLIVEVRDDGKGFDVDAAQRTQGDGHFGLIGMRERAARVRGSLTIESSGDRGAVVRCKVPGERAYRDVPTVGFRSWLRRAVGAPYAEWDY